MASNRAVLPQEKDKEIPAIATDFVYAKADGVDAEDGGVAWATTLGAIDKGLGYPFAVSVDNKEATNRPCTVQAVIKMTKQVCHRKVGLRHDGEPAMEELASRTQTAAKQHGLDVQLQKCRSTATRATARWRKQTT